VVLLMTEIRVDPVTKKVVHIEKGVAFVGGASRKCGFAVAFINGFPRKCGCFGVSSAGPRAKRSRAGQIQPGVVVVGRQTGAGVNTIVIQ
jgi:hypothetical protein